MIQKFTTKELQKIFKDESIDNILLYLRNNKDKEGITKDKNRWIVSRDYLLKYMLLDFHSPIIYSKFAISINVPEDSNCFPSINLDSEYKDKYNRALNNEDFVKEIEDYISGILNDEINISDYRSNIIKKLQSNNSEYISYEENIHNQFIRKNI